MGRIPKSYMPAEWRNTTPVEHDTNRIGIGFDASDGNIIRLVISIASARHLAESIQEFLSSHSVMSSGMPSVDVSKPPDGENV